MESDTRLHTNLVAMIALSENELQDLLGCCVASIMSLPAEDASVVQGACSSTLFLQTLPFYPTALKGCWGIVFTHGVRMGGRAGGWAGGGK